MTNHANYTRVKRTYQVSYVIDGKTVETRSVAYGDSIPTPTAAIPEKAGYPYSLWHAETDIVTGDTEVNAVYAEKLSYTANSKASIKDGVYYMPIVMNKHPDGRDTPAALNPARGYDSLIFYDWESDGAAPDPDKSIDRILTDLDLSYEKILADGTLLGAYCSGGQYSRSSSVSVTDSRVPFDRARHFSVHTKPSVDYGVQLSMNLPENSFEAGDVLVLSCWIRFVSAKVESNCGQLRFSCQHPTSYSKNLNRAPVRFHPKGGADLFQVAGAFQPWCFPAERQIQALRLHRNVQERQSAVSYGGNQGRKHPAGHGGKVRGSSDADV